MIECSGRFQKKKRDSRCEKAYVKTMIPGVGRPVPVGDSAAVQCHRLRDRDERLDSDTGSERETMGHTVSSSAS